MSKSIFDCPSFYCLNILFFIAQKLFIAIDRNFFDLGPFSLSILMSWRFRYNHLSLYIGLRFPMFLFLFHLYPCNQSNINIYFWSDLKLTLNYNFTIIVTFYLSFWSKEYRPKFIPKSLDLIHWMLVFKQYGNISKIYKKHEWYPLWNKSM